MKKASIFWRVFWSVLAVALGVVTAVGVIARLALASAFERYLESLPTPMGPGMGRHMMLGSAEQAFIASVDRSVLIGGVIAVAVAALAAWLIAGSLSRPLRDLEHAALALASGDLSQRVEARGPQESVALGEAFNGMAASLARAEGLRRRLVADVAHELRNPVAAARAQAEGMAEGVLPTTPARIRSVLDDLAHLGALIDDLQQLALSDAGELRYERGPVDLAALVRDETQRAAELARSGVAVEAAGAGERCIVIGDARRLSEVLRNLLGNATRHTSEGSVVARLARGGDRVTLRVVDTGEGIPAADLPNVFERFYRADAARAADSGGAGLGLAIVRRIVEDHGGGVFAEPTPGGGATVGFWLPAAS